MIRESPKAVTPTGYSAILIRVMEIEHYRADRDAPKAGLPKLSQYSNKAVTNPSDQPPPRLRRDRL